MTGARPRVLIADDHPIFRQGVRDALEIDGMDVCAEAATTQEAVELAVESKPAICLLDLSMPGGGGIAAAHALRRQLPEVRVVILSGFDDERHVVGALRAGADGYLLKTISWTRLAPTLRGVLNGESALSRTMTTHLIHAWRDTPHPRRVTASPGRSIMLTLREWETLEGLRDGLTTNQLAEHLQVAPVTVRTHVRALVQKAGVEDRGELLRVVEQGLLRPEADSETAASA
jgi:two-component system, NarL family, nitrate/nitrite response regulator NarL